MPKADLLHLADRVFGTPLLVTREKGEVILSALAERLGISPPLAEIPAFPERSKSSFEVVDGVAVIPVVGTLVNKTSGMDAMSGMTSYGSIAANLDAALSDPRVKGILLDIDSPGGECAGNFELAGKIFAARGVKPIHALANPTAASAAYAIAAAAEMVTAPPVSTVGSIGVISFHRDTSKADEAAGVKVTAVTAGARKADGWTPLTDDAHAAMQRRVDGIYDLFVENVAASRNLKPSAVRATEAGTFLGEPAKAAKLVDQVGGKPEALASLRDAIAKKEKPMKDLDEARAEIATLRATSTEQAAEHAKLLGERSALALRVAEFEAIALERQKTDDAAFLDRLTTESASIQAPIDAAKIEKVRAHLAAGRRDFALELGGELLEAAHARAGKKFSRSSGATLVPPKPQTKTDAQASAEILSSQGWTVTLNADQTEILTALQPGAAGSGKKE